MSLPPSLSNYHTNFTTQAALGSRTGATGEEDCGLACWEVVTCKFSIEAKTKEQLLFLSSLYFYFASVWNCIFKRLSFKHNIDFMKCRLFIFYLIVFIIFLHVLFLLICYLFFIFSSVLQYHLSSLHYVPLLRSCFNLTLMLSCFCLDHRLYKRWTTWELLIVKPKRLDRPPAGWLQYRS